MKILWLCNIVLPELADIFGFRQQNVGGWLTGMWEEIKADNEISLAICVPVRNPARLKDGQNGRYQFYSFLTISNESNTTIENQIGRLKDIIDDFNPDVIHVWGTEFAHSYAMIEACKEVGMLNKVIVNIQGLLTYYTKVYFTGLDIEKNNDINSEIKSEYKSYVTRTIYEQKMLQLTTKCIGRTDWDKACVKELNCEINYYYCGEILRPEFYSTEKWDIEKCKRHSIFISQAGYPIKGLHLVLADLKKICLRFPDAEIRIAGLDLSKINTGYPALIMKKIHELSLESNVIFLGDLTAEKMLKEYLDANVFLSASLIENSSNSICEAMMVGVPVVSSYVGGISSLIAHEESGFLYPLEEPYLMKYYIELLFENKDICKKISKNEMEKSSVINNKMKIIKRMKDIYYEVAKDI